MRGQELLRIPAVLGQVDELFTNLKATVGFGRPKGEAGYDSQRRPPLRAILERRLLSQRIGFLNSLSPLRRPETPREDER
jgi:hypothetical protein